MERYPFTVPIPVRFRDIDAMGHVNNAVFVTFLETARLELFETLFGTRRLEDIDVIVARVEVDYLRPVRLEQRVEVGMAVSSVGTTSFAVDYVVTADGEPAARARSVQVFYDYAAGAKKPVPEAFRAAAAPYQPPGERC